MEGGGIYPMHKERQSLLSEGTLGSQVKWLQLQLQEQKGLLGVVAGGTGLHDPNLAKGMLPLGPGIAATHSGAATQKHWRGMFGKVGGKI